MFLRGLLYLRPVTNCGRHVGFRSCVEPDSHRKSYSMVGRPSQTAYITADSLAEHVLVKPIALFPNSSEESIPDGEAEILAKVRPLLTASREDHSVYAHRLSAVLHLKGDEHTRFKCNRHVSCSYSKVAWDQAGKYLNCMQCFAPTR